MDYKKKFVNAKKKIDNIGEEYLNLVKGINKYF